MNCEVGEEMEILDYIWNGKYFVDGKHFKDLYSNFEHNLSNLKGEVCVNICNDISNCTTELQRVLLINSYFEWIPVPQVYFDRFQKSATLSNLLRQKANEFYETGISGQEEALRGFNLAVAFGRVGEEELGLAFGDRSALLVEMKEPILALRDIDLALASKYPNNLQKKLLDLTATCKQLLSSLASKQSVDEKNKKSRTKAYCEDNFFKLKSPSKFIDSVEDFVEIDYKEDRGRRLVVNKDVAAGTLIAVEQPYATVLENLLKWETKYCHCCTALLLAGIPCKLCTFCLYCSEECRDKASKGMHKYEDKYLPYLHCNQISTRDLLAARIIAIVGPQQLFNLFQRKDSNFFSAPENHIHGFNTENVYESSSYLAIYHLISHGIKDGVRPIKVVVDTFKALLLINILSETTDFFSQLKSSYTDMHSEKEFKNFIASMILHHMENIPFNAISLSKLNSSENSKIRKPMSEIKTETYGMALFSLVCLCNHSCSPNTVPVRKVDIQKTSLITLENLKAGDELFISYQPLFYLHETSERQNFLSEKFKFVCQCIACNNLWGPSALFSQPSINSSNRDKPEVECFKSKLIEADKLLEKYHYEEAIAILKLCLNYFSSNFPPCFTPVQDNTDLFKWALVWLVNECSDFT